MNRQLIDQAIQKKIVFVLRGTNQEVIKDVEEELHFKFPKEYVEFLISYGAMSIKDHEIFGIAPSTHLDILNNTLEERTRNDALATYVVIENLAFDGMLIVMDETGIVYEFTNESFEKIADSFQQYINQLINQ